MQYKESIEELLSNCYVLLNEENKSENNINSLIDKQNDSIKNELLDNRLIIEDNGYYKVTDKGKDLSKKMIRRQRLAERLLNDVLNLSFADLNKTACEFEHHINDELEEKVCSMLGHPDKCPHGKPIPQGECCKKVKSDLQKSNITIKNLIPGDEAVVVYLNTKNKHEMQKLMSIGLLPGTKIKVLRNYPSIVFNLGYSQFAVDENIAKIVFVKKIKN